ncbi:MAG: toxin-antitoxin system YwqK family antitoxin [Cytophaga sp.]|uniref:toxin-antitoxin system YwqK family antitoxin n=1 Tax=Cytophaga sp. TaxID=29535 RepID=UPI003F7F7E1C
MGLNTMHGKTKQVFTNLLRIKPELYSWPFMISLFLLFVNDFILKAAFPNTLTGKLSDFCGLYAFAFFFSKIFPENKKFAVHLITAVLFIIWKSPLSQPFITLFSTYFFTIDRVVDYTDLWALFVLPLSYFTPAKPFDRFYKTIGLSLIALIAFTATSQPRPRFHFFEPQYILLRNTKHVMSLSESGKSRSIEIDSLLLFQIEQIGLDKYPRLYDDFQQKSLLENLEKSIVSPQDLYTKPITLQHQEDSCLEKLSFLNGRLHGAYTRYINQQAIVSGFYKNGIPDSVWTYYTYAGLLDQQDIYENGEKVKHMEYSDGEHTSNSYVTTRQNKKTIAIIIFGTMCLVLLLASYHLWRQYKKAIRSVRIVERIIYPIILPIFVFIITFLLLGLLPGSDMLGAIGIQGLSLIIGCPVFFIIYFAIDKHSIYTFLLWMLIYILLIMLLHDFNFLNNLKDVSMIE